MSENRDDNARSQAKAQLESVVEMVAALERETAADIYVRDLSRERIIELLADLDEDTDEDGRDAAFSERADVDTDELRADLAREITNETVEPEDFEFDEDEARERIQDDALDVQVRSDWYSPGDEDGAKPSEYMILLCTGGPAVRIVGDLDEYRQPDRARIEYQDWGTPWTELVNITSDERAALLTYAQQFYFGE